MSRLTELALSFIDLAEAEGRELRRQTRDVLRGVALFFSGALLVASGVLVGSYALYSALASVIGRTLAALVAAVVLCVLGFAFMLSSSKRSDIPQAKSKETLPAKVNDNENSADAK